MMDFPLILHFFVAFIGTLGFCLLFHVPLRHIVYAASGGGLGWITYVYLTGTGNSPVVACFLGAIVVSMVAEVFSRAGKEATTLFIIPGIIPLVPGAPLYYTMREILDGDFSSAASMGAQVLFMAGSIAIAILMSASVTRLLVAVKNNLTADRS